MQKTIRIFLLILIIIGIGLLVTQKMWVPVLVNKILGSGSPEKQSPSKQITGNTNTISITSKKFKEKYFSGMMPVFSGSGTLVSNARIYVEKTIAEFRKQANTDVPGMLKQYGKNSPFASYEIDIGAKYVQAEKTDSIVMDIYTYTGGAHGLSLYKVITVSRPGGKILSLSDIIKKGQESAFTEFVKKELNDWRPDPNYPNDSPVFPDTVKDLKFSSFANWSLDDKNLTIYFDQYTIGPGVIGEVAFPIPLDKISAFLNSAYSSGTAGWKTFTDSVQGTTFKYPENISTTYISTANWPPKVQIVDGMFVCTNEGEVTSAVGQTLNKKINGRDYCVTTSTDGAAGSIYTNYAYATKIKDKLVSFSFSLRFIQCDNYDEPQKTDCKTERTTFSVDNLIDQIIQTTQ